MNKRSVLRALIGFLAASLLAGACGSEVTDERPQGSAGSSNTGAAGSSGGSTATGGGGSGGSTGAGGTAGAGGTGTAGSGGGVNCNPNGVVCATAPPQCPPGQVASIEGQCWGTCVSILSCATASSCADCEGAFCVAYVAFTTEYRCVLPYLQCSALSCGCLAPYFCLAPYDTCQTSGSGTPAVTCTCPAC